MGQAAITERLVEQFPDLSFKWLFFYLKMILT